MQSRSARFGHSIQALGLVLVAAAAVACGGSSPVGAPAGGTGSAGGSTGGSTTGTGSGSKPADISGESADPAVVETAITKLATLGSFSYETTIGASQLAKDYVLKITGVERPTENSRAYSATRNDGVDWSIVTVKGQFFGDIGRGLEPLDPRDDTLASTDPNWIGALMASFKSRAKELVVVGDETIEGRPVLHLALDEYAIKKITKLTKGGFETFSGEIWVDKTDGYLVKAFYGRKPFTTSGFNGGITEFTFELSDVGCSCPIVKPS